MTGRLFSLKPVHVATVGGAVALTIPLLVVVSLAGWAQAVADDLKVEVVAGIGHSSSLTSVAFSPDGRILASGSRYGATKLWDVASGRELRTLSEDAGADHPVAFSPDGRIVASGEDTRIKFWEVASGR